MPPSSNNESQGLKIATILLGILSFMLAIATYFGFSNAATADEKAVAAEKKAQEAQGTTAKVNATFDYLQKIAGYDKIAADDLENLRRAVDKDKGELDNRIKLIVEDVNKAITEVQGKGGDKQLSDLLQTSIRSRDLILAEPNQSLKSKLERVVDLMKNQSVLATALAMDNLAVRKDLEQVNSVNDAKVKTAEAAAEKANEDLRTEIAKHEDARKSDVAKLEEVANSRRDLSAKNSQLETERDSLVDTHKKERGDMLREQKDLKDRLAKSDIVLDVADGKVTFVDYRRNEVRVDLTRSQGVRPLMRFAIFDKEAQGLPTDRPKATIKITQVNDRDSLGTIEVPGNEFDKKHQLANPIYAGDQVYSSVWSPNDPKRIALVGPIDINRDGVDDRAELKRLIEQAGGKVDFDLPPPNKGPKVGKASGGFSMYVIDERNPYFRERVKEDTSDEYKKYEEEKAAATQIFRENGVMPMPVERLLGVLGYTYGMGRPGQTEAFGKSTYEKLRYPQGRGKPATTKDEPADSPGATEPDDQP